MVYKPEFRFRAAVALLSPALILVGTVLQAGPAVAGADYSEPKLLVGNIFPLNGPSPQALFKSERRSTSTGDKVHVSCDYTYPDGRLAARDRIEYQAGQLVSFTEEELQIAEKGSACIRPDAKHAGKSRIYFEYTTGTGAAARTSSASEVLEKDTLIDDMIPAFIVTHWDELEQGAAARFRYIVLSRKETIGFKLVKETESSWHGQPVVRVRMEPTSLIIAALVDPLSFLVEKKGQHRILQYNGRTTPLVKNGNKWKELDAVSIFEWKQELAGAAAASR